MMRSVSIIGAGLAGCEAALQLAKNGYSVKLYDAKPSILLPTYVFSSFAELVCNNSFAPDNTDSALGLLVAELKEMGSELIAIASSCRIADEKYFAIDKRKFSTSVSRKLLECGVQIVNQTVSVLPDDDIVILASGPLTNEALIDSVSKKYGVSGYHFSDASSVVVDIASIDLSNKHIKKITNDLYSVNIQQDVFSSFCCKLKDFSMRAPTHSVDAEIDFEKCQSLERLAMNGEKVLSEARFRHPYQAGNCLLLRRENGLENGYIMVGCMTTLRYPDQRAVFSILPGFENMRIIKYGRMHRNTFFHSPQLLDCFYKVKNTNLYIIGQLSGSDGYAPAISSGLVAALRIMKGADMIPFPQETMIGGLARYVSNKDVVDFQPMCASFSLVKNTEGCSYYNNSMKKIRTYKNSLQ